VNHNIPTRFIGLLSIFAVSIALSGAHTIFAHSRHAATSAQVRAGSRLAFFDGSGYDGTNRKRKGKGRKGNMVSGRTTTRSNNRATSNITPGVPATPATTQTPGMNMQMQTPANADTPKGGESVPPVSGQQSAPAPQVAVPAAEKPAGNQPPPPQPQGSPKL
jgi:hypothetical protein